MKNKILAWLIVGLAFFNFLFFGFYHLSKFETVDEHFWKDERIKQYWQAVAKKEWKKTYINDKPGVTVAIISGVGLLFEPNPEENKIRDSEESAKFNLYNLEKINRINLAFRLPLLLFNGLFLFYFFWIIKKITEKDLLAALTVMFLGFSPILIGISQIINPDTLLWTFSAAAVFTFFALIKKQERKILLLAGIFTGLSLLSKYTANILLPLYLMIIFFNPLFDWSLFKTPAVLRKYLLQQVFNFLFITALAVLLYALLLPASFIKSKYLLKGTLGFSGLQPFLLPIGILLLLVILDALLFKSKFAHKFFAKLHTIKDFFVFSVITFSSALFLFLIINSLSNQNFLPLDYLRSIAMNEGQFDFQGQMDKDFFLFRLIKILSAQFYPFVFSLSLPLLIGLVFFWGYFLFKKKRTFELYVFTLSFFPIIYFLALIASGVLSNARYSIMLYPLFSFLGAIGLWELIKNFDFKKMFAWIFLIIFIQIFSLWQIKPFYLNYANFLLPNKFSVHDGWGYGQYEAAQYLNSLPKASQLQIWTDRSGICQFFIGKCIRNYKIDLSKTRPDYFVISSRGANRHPFIWKYPELAKKESVYYYQEGAQNPAWFLFIDKRESNFIKVIKSQEN